ncbi:GCFC-domain-containing protein [Scleroderma citrinum]
MAELVFKKSKPRTGQRTRERDERDDDTTVVAKTKKRSNAKSKLSFGVDEDDGGEKVKLKKCLSRPAYVLSHPFQHACFIIQNSNTLPDTLDQATIRTNGEPVYDAAYLSQLKASMQSTRPPVHDAVYDADVSMSAELSVIDALDTSVVNDVPIPSQSSIQAAKEKRERLRTMGQEDDYISLTVTTRSDVYQGPHPESRLMREEDDLGEGDDEFAEYTSARERIALGKKSRKLEATKRKDAMQELITEANEEDEESLEWEREQLRRGGLDAFANADAANVKQVYKPAPIPLPADVPALGPAVDRLAQSLAALKASHTSNTNAAESLLTEQDQLDARETELREMIAKAETKRRWFADFKEFMESVATFLDEKCPELEELEEKYLSIIRERAEKISQRRRNDDEGDLALVFGSPPEPLAEEELDELGRVVPRANPVALRKERRVARVMRRRRRQLREGVSEADDKEEGYSTDASLPDDKEYQATVEKITDSGGHVFSDVQAEEFRDPSLGIGKWFRQWRRRYGDSYTGAWGGLGLLGAWEFWTRLELSGWNPLEEHQALDEFDWFKSLYEYSHPQDDDDDDDDEDVDVENSELPPEDDLVSAMISTTVVPHICKVLGAGGLDPYSATHLEQLIYKCEELEAFIGVDHHKYLMVLKTVYTAFENAVVAAETLSSPFVRFNSPEFDPDGIATRRRLLTRASKLLNMMLGWRKYAGDKLGMGQLCVRFINNYVLPIARSGWEVGGEEKVRQMKAALPQELAASVNL